MTRKELNHIQWSCKRKVGYGTSERAAVAMNVLDGRRSLAIVRQPLHTYHCPYCSKWHVGRQPAQLSYERRLELAAELKEGQSDWWPVNCFYSGIGGVQ